MKKFLLSAAMLSMAVSTFAQVQWPDEGLLIRPEHKKEYGHEMAVDIYGNAWNWNYDVYSAAEDLYDQRIQKVTPSGELPWGINGKSLCCYKNDSWTKCNTTFLPLSDGTMVVVIPDKRSTDTIPQYPMAYYAYRLDQNGWSYWGNGIQLNDMHKAQGPVHVSMCELPDKSIVFAWEEVTNDDMRYTICQQRLTFDGKKMYDLDEMRSDDNKTLKWPTIVSDEHGGYFMVFGRTDSWYIYVQHYDAQGHATWDAPQYITRQSGWSGQPMWAQVNCCPSGDGNLLVYWRDSREYGPMYPYLAYILQDGTSTFVNAAGTLDNLLSYAGLQTSSVRAIPDPDGSGFMTAFAQTIGSTDDQIVLQRVNKDGELEFGDKGLVIKSGTNLYVTGLELAPGPKGQVAVCYLFSNTYDIDSRTICIELHDIKTGELIGNEPIFTFAPRREIGDITFIKAPNDEFWMLNWLDAGAKGDKYYDGKQNQYILRVNFDGTSVSKANDYINGIQSISADENDEAIYNINGQRIAEPEGLYIKAGKKYMIK